MTAWLSFLAFCSRLFSYFIFGAISRGGGAPSFNVALLNNSHTPYAEQFAKELSSDKTIKVNKTITSEAEANDRMGKGQLDATIILPPDFGQVKDAGYPTGKAQVVYTQNNEQAGRGLATALEGEFSQINQELTRTKAPLQVESKRTSQKSLTSFDYTFAGLLGFAIIGMGIFGPINVFPELKKQGILRRLHTTPLKTWQYFLSTMISQAIIGLVSLSVMFVAAIAVFHLRVIGNWLEIALFIVLSIMTILGIGLAIGGWAKNERQAAPLSNIVVFPMMFLSGTFFPRFLMPQWLQHVSNFLPLTPVIDGLRLLTTEGKHLIDLGPQLGLMAAWLLVIYFIAFRVFRWE